MTEHNDEPGTEKQDPASEPDGGEASADGGGALSTKGSATPSDLTDPVHVNVDIWVPRGEPSVVHITIDGTPSIKGGPGLMSCKGPETADTEFAFVRFIPQ